MALLTFFDKAEKIPECASPVEDSVLDPEIPAIGKKIWFQPADVKCRNVLSTLDRREYDDPGLVGRGGGGGEKRKKEKKERKKISSHA